MEDHEWYKVWFLFLSNLVFFVTSLIAFSRYRYLQAAFYFTLPFTSGFYHLCKVDWIDDAGDGGFCFGFEFEQMQKIDFFFASMTIPFAFLYLITFSAIVIKPSSSTLTPPKKPVKLQAQKPKQEWISDDLIVGNAYNRTAKLRIEDPSNEVECEHEPEDERAIVISYDKEYLQTLIIYAYAIAIGFYLVNNKVSSWIGVHLTISSLALIVIYTSFTYLNYRLIPKFDYTFLTIGLLLSLLAITLMLIQDHVSGSIYWFVHSFWHVLGALGHCFLILSTKTVPGYAASKYGDASLVVPKGLKSYAFIDLLNDNDGVVKVDDDAHRYQRVFYDLLGVRKIFDWLRVRTFRSQARF